MIIRSSQTAESGKAIEYRSEQSTRMTFQSQPLRFQRSKLDFSEKKVNSTNRIRRQNEAELKGTKMEKEKKGREVEFGISREEKLQVAARKCESESR